MKTAVFGKKLSLTMKVHKLHQTIRDTLENMGVDVDFSYFDTTTDEDTSDLEKAYMRNQKLIRDSDFVIAETTDYSAGIGYLIADALHEKKPVLALFNKKGDKLASNIIKSSASKSKSLTFVEYIPDQLEDVLKKFVTDVSKKLDTKFILIISPEIDRYLEWASDYKRMHKAQIVRNAVEKEMENDEDYIRFLKQKNVK